MIKYLCSALGVLLMLGCNREEVTPSFSFDSYSYLTHNSVLVTYKNLNGMNEYPSGVRVAGRIASSNDTMNYFNAIFSPIEMNYSTMLFDLIPDTKYSISFYYGHKIIASETFDFKTKNVEYFTDIRDGYKYPIGQYGSQWWMLENLNYQTSDAISLTDSLLTGKYYTWESAKASCPPGWHLPSDEEWIELERFIGISEDYLYDISQLRGRNEVVKLLTPSNFTLYSGLSDNIIVNELGFSLKACGYILENRQNEYPQSFGLDSYYWSSSEYNSTDAFYHGASYKAITGSSDSIMAVRLYMLKDNKMCVRCVKD